MGEVGEVGWCASLGRRVFNQFPFPFPKSTRLPSPSPHKPNTNTIHQVSLNLLNIHPRGMPKHQKLTLDTGCISSYGMPGCTRIPSESWATGHRANLPVADKNNNIHSPPWPHSKPFLSPHSNHWRTVTRPLGRSISSRSLWKEITSSIPRFNATHIQNTWNNPDSGISRDLHQLTRDILGKPKCRTLKEWGKVSPETFSSLIQRVLRRS